MICDTSPCFSQLSSSRTLDLRIYLHPLDFPNCLSRLSLRSMLHRGDSDCAIICFAIRLVSREDNSRVVRERRFQMLGQSLKVVPELLELAVGHRRLRTRHGRDTEHTGRRGRSRGRPWWPSGDLLSSTNPPGNVWGEKMSLTSSSTSLRRRRANATQTPIDSCVAVVARLLVREGGRRGYFLVEARERERWN